MATKNRSRKTSTEAEQHEWRAAKLAAVMTLLATVVAVASSFLTVKLQDGQETERQVRAMKQVQYAEAVQAINIELQSMTVLIDRLARDEKEKALAQLEEYAGADEVVRQSASLALVSDGETLDAMSALVDARATVNEALIDVALKVDAGDSLNEAALAPARTAFASYQDAHSDLVVAMRIDLGLPGDL